MEPVVYLPVEIKFRELPSRLVIAAHLLSLGLPVVVGNHWAMTSAENQAALPQGAFLYKSVNKLQGNVMALSPQNGHIVGATDEEVLVFTDYNGFITVFAENAATHCSVFFAQSEAHARAVEKRWPVLTGRVRVTGNVRIDLLSAKNRAIFDTPDPAIEACKPYVLFNSNIGTINSVWAESNRVMAMASATSPFGPEETARNVQAITAWEQQNYQQMMALLNWTLRSAKGLNVVVRPHPAERTANWEKALAPFPRAKMVPRSDPHPWIAGAELIVHTGCTTGLEAAMMGKPTINLLASNHPFCGQIVTEANPTFRNAEAAAAAMAEFLTQKSGPIAAYQDFADRAIAAHWPSFGKDAAARLIAEGIVKELKDRGAAPRADFKLAWRKPFTEIKLQNIQRDKFSVTPDEMIDGFRKASLAAGFTGEVAMSTISEGLFLFAPQT